MKQLSALSIITMGFCLFLIGLLIGYSQYAPNARETTLLKDSKAALDTEADKMPRAKKRVEHARDAIYKKAAEWKAIVDMKTPSTRLQDGGIDVSENGAQLMVDSYKFHNSLQQAINAQIKRGGVKVMSSVTVPLPGSSAATILAEYYNYPAIPFPVVIFDLGTVTVQGTYDQIMANVRSYTTMPHYLVVADGLRLEGTAPLLQGTYAISLVGYVKGSKVFTSLPEIPGSGSGGAGAAGGSAPTGKKTGGPTVGSIGGFGSGGSSSGPGASGPGGGARGPN